MLQWELLLASGAELVSELPGNAAAREMATGIATCTGNRGDLLTREEEHQL